MKKHLIVVLSLILILCSVKVFAECGWVLWTKSEMLIFKKNAPPAGDKTWEIIAATPKFEQCLELQKTYWNNKMTYYKDSTKSPGIKEVEGNQPSGIFIRFLEDKEGFPSFLTESLLCIPSNIDPREKK